MPAKGLLGKLTGPFQTGNIGAIEIFSKERA